MATINADQDSAYRDYVRMLRELHQLWVDGREESAEAEALCNQMDAAWEGLNSEMKETVGGLASDLNWIRRGPVAGEQPEEDVLREARPALASARQAGDWHGTLRHLRRCAPYLPQANVAFLRGRAWSELGDEAIALLFFEHARRLDPRNGNLALVALASLSKVDPTLAQRRASEVLDNPLSRPFAEIVKAADVRFQSLRNVAMDEARPVVMRLSDVLKTTLQQMRAVGDDVQNPVLYAMAVGLAGSYFEFLGDVERALDSYGHGLQVSPNDDRLLVARGMLLYGRETSRALGDLQRAIDLGSTLVWPYFFVAYHALLDRRFGRCLELCALAMRLSSPPTVRANLLEWIGICQWQLRFPADVVRASFKAARHLAPENDRIRRNAELFERSQKALPPEATWEGATESDMRAIGQAEFQPVFTK